jgi:MoaA/NifB/PqqE/SkfB family radical SAM enzyme
VLHRIFGFYDAQVMNVLIPWILAHPRYLVGALRLASGIRRSSRARKQGRVEGLMIPPFLIISITRNCNLRCAGCIAAATGTTLTGSGSATTPVSPRLPREQWRSIIEEARALGVFGFIIVGGEPFLYPDLLDMCQDFPDRFFVILTNGTALSAADLSRLKRSTNVVVVVSIEGGEDLTDARRGPGIYGQAMTSLRTLAAAGIPTGISVTVTQLNYAYWMEVTHLDQMIDQGIRLALFFEYIPSTPSPVTLRALYGPDDWSTASDHDLMLTDAARAAFREAILHFRRTKPLFIIHSPADEEYFGGCVSAGKAFAHITPGGDLTPCPVSNIATHNLTVSSLKEGLASPLFTKIRDNEQLLDVDGVPCALFAHPQEVEDLVKDVGAYRTGHNPD